MLAHQLKVKGKTKSKRVGRGGKKGTYCGRGGKGQSARKGYSQRATFEGGSTSIVSFSKKNRGFKVPEKKVQLVNLNQLNRVFSVGETVDVKSLKEKKLISNLKFSVKILADGELDKKLIFIGLKISRSAQAKIEKAGGEVKNLPVDEQKKEKK